MNSFVYRRRRPFHPLRLHAFLSSCLMVDDDWQQREPPHDHDHDDDDDDHDHHHHHEPPQPMSEEERVAFQKQVSEAHTLKKQNMMARVMRSKGHLWIATRPMQRGSWNQAGAVLRIDPEDPWYAALPPDAWPHGEKQDIWALMATHDEHGDRRQELVFIGLDMDEAFRTLLSNALDECLVTDEEWEDLPKLCATDPIALWDDEPFEGWDEYLVEQEES